MTWPKTDAADWTETTECDPYFKTPWGIAQSDGMAVVKSTAQLWNKRDIHYAWTRDLSEMHTGFKGSQSNPEEQSNTWTQDPGMNTDRRYSPDGLKVQNDQETLETTNPLFKNNC